MINPLVGARRLTVDAEQRLDVEAEDGDLVLFCHNVDNLNWGCRATSLALYANLRRPGRRITAFSRRTAANPIVRFVHVRRPRPVSLVEGWALQRASTSGLARSVSASDVVAASVDDSLKRLERARRWNPTVRAVLGSIDRASAVVVNGEGSMIFRSPTRRDLMFQMAVLAYAQRRGVPSAYVNAVVSPCPQTGVDVELAAECSNVLAACDDVLVRDPDSHDFLRSLGYAAGNDRVTPDALFTWAHDRPEALVAPSSLAALEPPPERSSAFMGNVDINAPYLCVSGGSTPLPIDDRARVTPWVALVGALRNATGLPVVLVQPCTGDRFLHDVGRETGAPVVRVESNLVGGCGLLANAAVYVSGRYHPSVMASLGGTPLVTMTSNSHKLRGLSRLLGTSAQLELDPASPHFVEAAVVATEHQLADHDRTTTRSRAAQLGKQAHDTYAGLPYYQLPVTS